MNSIGTTIRRIRTLKGYSQDYIASLLDMSQTNYSRIENDRCNITVDYLFKIARILEVDIVEFFADSLHLSNQNSKGSDRKDSPGNLITREQYESQLSLQRELYEARIDDLKQLYETLLKASSKILS